MIALFLTAALALIAYCVACFAVRAVVRRVVAWRRRRAWTPEGGKISYLEVERLR